MQSKSPELHSLGLLPPIVIDSDVASSTGHQSPIPWKSSNPDQKLWSRYHRGCMKRDPNFMDWSVRKEKKIVKYKDRRRYIDKDVTSKIRSDAFEYLDNNKDIVEAYVLDSVSIEQLEIWLQQKIGIHSIGKQIHNSPQRIGSIEKLYKKDRFLDVIQILREIKNEDTLLWELAKYITNAISVDAYRVCKLYPEQSDYIECFISHPKKQKRLSRIEAEHLPLILDVAKKGIICKLSRENNPTVFPGTPQSLFKAFKLKNVEANHVMYQPVMDGNGKTAYIIEMWRVTHEYKDVDVEICSDFMMYSSIAMHYCDLYMDKKRERSMTDFLLGVVKAIFEEMVSLDQLIKRILEFAQRLVNADRASLFLVDYRNFELVSTVFDLKFEKGLNGDVEKKEIRMPINRGIAGHVALSGETMNIPDAYSDHRFNRAVDEATGYKTVNILCMPIKVQGKVIGVVQMVNKRNANHFDHEDEVAFETFSTFFGLALHHARLYDRIMRKEQKYRVALEVLSYHNTCRENEVQAILNDNDQINFNLNDFYLDPFQFNEFEKCKTVIGMFTDLFDITEFDIMTVTRFILTVKKNYRTVPYHNFDHGWSVANAMYVILKNDVQACFDYKMRLSLFVACLCHDLDHRGYTNKYMNETASPLASMYTTSTLEHHHFNITVTILQQDGHNIFSHMTSKDYKEVLSLIKQCILATDLAAFFPNLDKIKILCDQDQSSMSFSWGTQSHRELAMAVSMTAADLSASAKPWNIQIKTVKVIFEEFYDQGDKEKQAGITPIPMMDRNKPEEQPASQVGFLSQICLPCYTILHKILPSTRPMYIMALKNLDKWKSRASIFKELKDSQSLIKLKNANQYLQDVIDAQNAMENAVLDEQAVNNTSTIFEATNMANETVKIESNKLESLIDVVPWEDEEEIEDDKKIETSFLKVVDWAEEDGVVVEPTSSL